MYIADLHFLLKYNDFLKSVNQKKKTFTANILHKYKHACLLHN